MKFLANDLSKPALTVGEFMVPGNDDKHMCKPADVAVLKNGDFFVADGYCNSRIVKFSKTGQYLDEWWSNGDKSTPSKFAIVHSIALHESGNLVCVADRQNCLIQCFDLTGKFLFETNLKDYGPIYAVTFAASNASVVYAINELSMRSYSRVIMISTKTGKVLDKIDLSLDEKSKVNQIESPHAMSISDDASEIYIGTLKPPAVYKYKLENCTGKLFSLNFK
jgi:hypothetical protein